MNPLALSYGSKNLRLHLFGQNLKILVEKWQISWPYPISTEVILLENGYSTTIETRHPGKAKTNVRGVSDLRLSEL
jgi:hypothetical protein